jgi:hypothetical protein
MPLDGWNYRWWGDFFDPHRESPEWAVFNIDPFYDSPQNVHNVSALIISLHIYFWSLPEWWIIKFEIEPSFDDHVTIARYHESTASLIPQDSIGTILFTDFIDFFSQILIHYSPFEEFPQKSILRWTFQKCGETVEIYGDDKEALIFKQTSNKKHAHIEGLRNAIMGLLKVQRKG